MSSLERLITAPAVGMVVGDKVPVLVWDGPVVVVALLGPVGYEAAEVADDDTTEETEDAEEGSETGS